MDQTITIIHDDKELDCTVEYTTVLDNDYYTLQYTREVFAVYLPDECYNMGVLEQFAIRKKVLAEFHNLE